MKQDLCLESKTICSKPRHFPKPSVVLKKAYLKGAKRSINSFKNGDSYCARGIIIKEFAEFNGFNIDKNYKSAIILIGNDNIDSEIKDNLDYLGSCFFEYELFSWYKFKRHFNDLTHFERTIVGRILFELGLYNDKNPNITFMDCAKYLEGQGL